MAAGSVPVAFVRNVNPAYTSPKSAGFAEAFAKVAFKVSFSSPCPTKRPSCAT